MHSVIIVGSGFGGISAAINLRKQGISDFIILERRNFGGGTWLQNSYPGAAVDVPSPLYSVSGNPYPWQHLYAKQHELASYTQQLLQKHQLNEHIHLNAVVNEARWCDDHWQVTLSNNESYKCQSLINATGPLSTPVVPEFTGLANYKGLQFHSNDWQHNVELKDKRVAIVGSGASSAQIVPAIVEDVEKLHVLQRSPHWILPRNDWAIPAFLQNFLALTPVYLIIRWTIYWLLELRVIAFKYSNTLLKWLAKGPALKHLKRQVSDDALRKRLTPDFTIGCKRILVSNTFYPALQRENCSLHDSSDGIVEFTAKGFVCAQSGEHEVDVVIFATGYNAVDAMVSYPVIGKHGQELAKTWREYPRAYLGTSVPNFPNFFVVTGPNTGIGHTSAIFVIESQMKYIVRCVQKLVYGGVKSIEPTEYAEQQYTSMVHSEMEKTVWSHGGCTSWYQNKKGKVIAMFPGFSFTFRRLCKRFKSSDHNIER